MKEITITDNEQNQRLDKFLFKYFNTAPKSFVYKMLRKKRIKYNLKKAEGSEMLKSGDSLQMYLGDDTIDGFMEEKTIVESKRHFGIVYEDDNVLVVNKPAGLLTHPEKSTDTDTLIDQILYYLYEKGQYVIEKESSFIPAVCNRLDRNTSGIIIAGKNLMAVQGINKAISEQKLHKYYITLVKGSVKSDGEAVGYHTKSSADNMVKILKTETEASRKVITKYKVIAAANNYTLLEVNLVTGRPHQIRAHFKTMGYPVVGDRKYGNDRTNINFKEKYALSNQFLHACRLVWDDDDSQLSYLKGKELTAPLPEALNRIKVDIFG